VEDPTVIVEEKPGEDLNHDLTNFILNKFGKRGNLNNTPKEFGYNITYSSWQSRGKHIATVI